VRVDALRHPQHPTSAPPSGRAPRLAAQRALTTGAACAQLMHQVALAREEAAAAGRALDADALAERLRGLGHSVTVRHALGGGGGGECLRNLRHPFLSCAGHGPRPPAGRRPAEAAGLLQA